MRMSRSWTCDGGNPMWPSGDWGVPDPYEDWDGTFRDEEEKRVYIADHEKKGMYACPACGLEYDDFDMALNCCQEDVR